MVRIVPILALVLAGSQLAAAAEIPPDQRFVAGRLPCAEPWDGRANGWRQLAWELMKRTSVEADLETRLVEPGSADLFKTPFLIWSCPGPVAPLSDNKLALLRRFLKLGGFLLVDDPDAQPGGPFEQSVREVLSKLFPREALTPLAWDNVLFKTFFLVDEPGGRVAASPRLSGLVLDDRLAVVLSTNDLLGAMSRDLYGGWEFSVEAGSFDRREVSFRVGINLIFYALCLDYKDDRVHLPFILKRRRL